MKKEFEFDTKFQNTQSPEEYYDLYNRTGDIKFVAYAGELFYKQGKIKDAKRAYDEIIENNDYVSAVDYYEDGIKFYFNIKDYDRVSEAFELCYPYATSEQMIKLGDAFYKNKVFDKAERWYISAISEFKVEKNKYLSHIQDNIGDVSKDVLKLLKRADEYFLEGKFKFALPLYKKALKHCQYAKIKYAECCFMLKDFEKAKTLYRELVQKTDDGYFMFMLAECYNSEEIDVNTLENAIYWYEYALEKGCNLCYYHLGICYEFGRGTDENAEKAVKMYRKGLEYEVDKDNCFCKLGNYYYKNKELEKAIKYYKEAATLGNYRALLNIAIVYFEKGLSCFSYEEIKCFLAKSAALGSKRAYEMLIKVKELDENQ